MSQTVTAHQKYLRLTSRKLRLVADSVRYLPVAAALTKLQFTPKRAALEIKKVLIQAQKNAVNNSHLNADTLIIQSIRVDEGPTYKRWQPVSRGRAHPIMKRQSHLTIAVTGEVHTEKPLKPKTAKPEKTKQNSQKKEKNGPKS